MFRFWLAAHGRLACLGWPPPSHLYLVKRARVAVQVTLPEAAQVEKKRNHQVHVRTSASHTKKNTAYYNERPGLRHPRHGGGRARRRRRLRGRLVRDRPFVLWRGMLHEQAQAAKQSERQAGFPSQPGLPSPHPKIFLAGCYQAEIAEIPPPGVSWSAARSVSLKVTVAVRELGSGAQKGRGRHVMLRGCPNRTETPTPFGSLGRPKTQSGAGRGK
jgi:hypothetical protein